MVKVDVDIILYKRVCVKEYVSFNIKNVDKNTVSVYKKAALFYATKIRLL